MKHDHSKDKIKEICGHLGEDLNAEPCQEVAEHLAKCPNCKIYFDTIRKTVILCKTNDCAEKLPEDVNERLLKRLDLDSLQ
jgi:predicted anti-sigma-YlaC factor YlaD